MTIGIWILGDQLWAEQSALSSCVDQKERSPVIFIESMHHAQELPYHLQKLVLVWSAMRHFAQELRESGWDVTYAASAPDFKIPLLEWIEKYQITELRVMTPTDRPFTQLIQNLKLPCQITFTTSNRFIWTDSAFIEWANSRKRLVMEDFYREGRRRFNVLMVEDQPLGGRWNFDRENRKPPKGKLTTPEALWFEPDQITQEVIDWVKQSPEFKNSQDYWQIEPFKWGVTRQQALKVLEFFVQTRLSDFGPYQDAMVMGEQTMWHGMLSAYLNIGLLHPLEVIEAAQQAYSQNQQWSLNSIEGFIRQILGWREYMHGIYLHMGEDYPNSNYFNHTQPLPAFYWTGETKMNCLHQILTQVKETGYAHHIQRLMVLSNFGLIAGISPQELQDWFHTAFIDGYDWVMQTNVIGMGQFADGGLMASKPYAASANYINNMSNYCQSCVYNQRDRTGENACPFNFFYWDFLDRHYDKLKLNHRMGQILYNVKRFSDEERELIRQQAAQWRANHLQTEYFLPSTPPRPAT